MAEVMSPLQHSHTMSAEESFDDELRRPERIKQRLATMSIPLPIAVARNGQISLDVFSPVNQNGSFEFDKVLKSGHVYKRSRRTKQWKKFFLVLRPNLLSMYKNESEVKLLKQVNLSELTAVNILKDPKGRRKHTFGLFTASHNYRFQAGSDVEASNWVDLIRKEARIDEEEETMIFGSPITTDPGFQNFGRSMDSNHESGGMFDRLASSSPEPAETQPQASGPLWRPKTSISTSQPRKQSLNEYDYSGQEQGSYSDFSDAAPQSLPRSSYNLPRSIPIRPLQTRTSSYTSTLGVSIPTTHQDSQPQPQQTNPQHESSTTTTNTTKPEHENTSQRVLWQGYLLCLKSAGGVRQWKRLWAVLRPAHLAFYKNDEEYSTHLLLPLPTILSAFEIDPLSRSKAHCMQIIAEERNYRFCAESEDQLARCLGAVKSLLARRKGTVAGTAGTGTGTAPATAASAAATGGIGQNTVVN